MSVVLLLSCLMSLLALSQGDRFKLGDTLANANLFGVCEQTTKTAALVQQLDVDCDGVRQSGKAIVLGVARLTCATGLVDGVCSNTVSPLNAYAYIVGVQMQFSAKSTVTCNTTVPWYLVPNGNVNCFSAERCYTQSGDPSSACKEIFLKGISVTLSSPTYMRTINPTGVEFPYTYVQLSREKMAGASASYNNPIPGDSPELRRTRTLQSQLMLANDDADDNYKRCLQNTKFEQGIRTRGCCSTHPLQKDDGEPNQRAYGCTQDFYKCCCENNDQDSRTLASEGCVIKYCNQNTDRSNNALNYLSSTSNCWSLEQGQAPQNISSWEYLARIGGYADKTISCCKNPVCNNPCIGSSPCDGYYCVNGNKDFPEPCNNFTHGLYRYIFPAWTPRDLFQRYAVGLGSVGVRKSIMGYGSIQPSLRVVNMSCDLEAATNGSLARNTTRLGLYGVNDITTDEDLAYYYSLIKDNDVPENRKSGVWRSITQHGKIRSLICGRCAQLGKNPDNGCREFNPLITDTSCYKRRTASSTLYKGEPNPTVWAEKTWIIGSSPSSFTNTFPDTSAILLVDVKISMTTIPGVLSLGYSDIGATSSAINSANTLNVMIIGLTINTNPCDPYASSLPSGASVDSTEGMVVMCEPYVGAASKRLKNFGASNPWDRKKCADGSCLPDYQTTTWTTSFPGRNIYQPTLIYYIQKAIEQSYAVNPSAFQRNCGTNGFSDEIFAYQDDNDQVQVHAPSPFDAPIRKDRIEQSSSFTSVSRECLTLSESRGPDWGCPAGDNAANYGKSGMIGREQTALCMQEDSATTFCRPSFTSAAAGSLFEQLRRAIINEAKPDEINRLRTEISSKILPPQWRKDYPNFWFGANVQKKSQLVMYYQQGVPFTPPQDPKAKADCSEPITIYSIVGDKSLTFVPTTPTPILVSTSFCPCQKPDAAVSGSLVLKHTTEDASYITTGFPYTLELTWNNLACTITSPLTVLNKPDGKGTSVPFKCPKAPQKTFTAPILKITPVLSSTSLQQKLTSTFYLKSCDCYNEYGVANVKDCLLVHGQNGVYFELNAKGGSESCSSKPNTPTGNTEPINPTPPASSTGSIPGTTNVPTPTKPAPIPPNPSVSPTKGPSDKDAQNAQGTGTEEAQDWTIYYIIGGVVATAIGIAIVVGAAIWIGVSYSQSKKKKLEATKRAKSQ